MPFIVIILFGALASCSALIFEFIFLAPASSSLNQSITLSLATALSLLGLALIEETSKYFFLRQYALQYFRYTAGTMRTALFLGALFGIGFSLLEIFLSSQNGLPAPFFAILSRTFLHMGTSSMFASFIFRPSGTTLTLKALWLILAITLIHIVYNLSWFLAT